MSSAGQELLREVTTALWDLLDRCRTQAAGVLAGLGPDLSVAGTILDGRLLEAFSPDAIAAADPAVTILVAAFKALLPAGLAGPVSLHGFDPGDGQPRGLALVTIPPGPAVTVVAAITGAGPTGIAFEIAAVGAGAFGPVPLDLLGGWSIDLSGDAGGGARLEFPRGGPPSVIDAGVPVTITWALKRDDDVQPTLVGPAEGPHLSLPSVSVTVTTGVDGAGAPTVAVGIAAARAELSLAADVLAALVGSRLSIPIDLDLDANPQAGLVFAGGGVRATVPARLDLPLIDLHAVDVELASQGGGLVLGFGAAFTGGLPGLPLSFTVDGLGATFPVAFGGGGLGIDPAGVRPALPTGLGIDLTLPLLSGGGFLATTGPGGYGGVLDLDLIVLSVQAFGLLQLPVNGVPLSFVAILSVQFPFPGIQLGFGFSLNGVGGLVAVNRRLDSPALQAAVIDGSANQLLFPVDPAAHGPAIVATLGRVFPAAAGHLVVGPMLQIGWGGRIVTLSVAVVLDLPNPVQFVIIGRVAVTLPDPAAPLILIQATVVGVVQLSPDPSISVLASLDGSNIAGIPVDGDLYFLIRSGDDAAFVFSAGGFHPRFNRPSGVPALNRLQLAITPPGFPGLRSETYFAVTSNTVQFGAHLELCDEIAGCGVDGWFQFDALFQWDPVFAFSIHCSAGVAVQVLGETLMGISFDLTLEGPAPWHIQGSGTVSLFLFSASLDFEVHWGPSPPTLPPATDLGPVLAAALANPSAWIGTPPADEKSMVTLSQKAAKQIGEGHTVHPLGQVAVRQRAVPLDIKISRYQNLPVPPQTWSLSAANPGLGDVIQDEFPPASFLDLSEDQKLTRSAFERFSSGAALTPNGVIASDLRPVNTDFEVVLIPDISLGVPLGNAFVHLVAESWLAVGDPHQNTVLWNPPGAQPVVVLPAQPVAPASTRTLQVQAVAGQPSGFTATLQAAQAQFGAIGPAAAVQIVEQWELMP